TFFQAIGDGKTDGILVMLRQIILFIPAVILLTRMIGAQSLWYVLPIIDGVVVLFGNKRYFIAVKKNEKK
ncbi:MATE family efflux transporter, partial [Parvimonas sp. M20]|nr:MATE family efflux transporter [Parvimonas sp. M20]